MPFRSEKEERRSLLPAITLLIKYIIVFIDSFLHTCESQHTRRAYRTDLQHFQGFVSAPLSEIEKQEVQSFVRERRNAGDSPSTLRRRMSALRAFYDWMMQEDKCPRNPARQVQISTTQHETSTNNSALSLRETRRLLEKTAGDARRDVRARALLLVILFGALRRRDVTGLQRSDIRPLGRRWIIDLDSTNGAGGYVPIPDVVAEAVEELTTVFGIERGPLWRSLSNRNVGEPLTPDAVYKIVRGLGEDAGLDTRVTIDRLRRTGTQLAFEAGVRIDHLQTHARLKNTESVSNHLTVNASTAGFRRDVHAALLDVLFE